MRAIIRDILTTMCVKTHPFVVVMARHIGSDEGIHLRHRQSSGALVNEGVVPVADVCEGVDLRNIQDHRHAYRVQGSVPPPQGVDAPQLIDVLHILAPRRTLP